MTAIRAKKGSTEFYRPTEKGEQRERSGAMDEEEKVTHKAERLGGKVGVGHQTSIAHSSLTRGLQRLKPLRFLIPTPPSLQES